ncbi:hypothetical protein ROT00_08155 [Agromyces mediolanus]|uniref:hypothetical protein n=1 Tax=Agromyces mediolanus TaxID=41986 RepID=UPI0038392E3C
MPASISPDWLPAVADWLAGVDLVPVALSVVVAALGIRVLVRLWPWLRRVVALVEALDTLPGFIERTDASVHRLRRQVENDHDTNLRDELSEALGTGRRLEGELARLAARIDALAAAAEELRAADRRLEDELHDELRHDPGDDPATGARPRPHLTPWSRR